MRLIRRYDIGDIRLTVGFDIATQVQISLVRNELQTNEKKHPPYIGCENLANFGP